MDDRGGIAAADEQGGGASFLTVQPWPGKAGDVARATGAITFGLQAALSALVLAVLFPTLVFVLGDLLISPSERTAGNLVVLLLSGGISAACVAGLMLSWYRIQRPLREKVFGRALAPASFLGLALVVIGAFLVYPFPVPIFGYGCIALGAGYLITSLLSFQVGVRPQG